MRHQITVIEPSDAERSEWPFQTEAYVCGLEAENAMLKEELEQHRWIRVEEKLPETANVYLTMYKGDGRLHLRKEMRIRAYPFSGFFRDAWVYKKPTKYSVLYWKPIVLPKD